MFYLLPEDLILTSKESWSASSSGADSWQTMTLSPTKDKSCRVHLGFWKAPPCSSPCSWRCRCIGSWIKSMFPFRFPFFTFTSMIALTHMHDLEDIEEYRDFGHHNTTSSEAQAQILSGFRHHGMMPHPPSFLVGGTQWLLLKLG